MGRYVNSIVGSITFTLIIATASLGQEDKRQPELLAPVPKIQLDSKAYLATVGESKAIQKLIDGLSEIEDPDLGFAPWMSGSHFAPIGETRKFGTGIIMINHGLKTDDALRRLVAFGPKSLPLLLERLSDETPTKLSMEHEGMFGVQWYGREVQLNLARPVERNLRQVFSPFFKDVEGRFGIEEHVPKHVITVGDVCFVIIGQIVNRNFQSVRYQPTACRVINSPTHDPAIAKVVRSVWSNQDSAQMLVDSLLDDLYTNNASYVQPGAAMRLLYYFPNETGELIGRRIRSLDLSDPTDTDAWKRIHNKNGLDATALLKAVRTSEHPAVIDALLEVVQKAEDRGCVDAAINASVVNRDRGAVFNRIRDMISVAPPAEQGPFGSEYSLLKVAAHHFPDKSAALFVAYRKHNTTDTLRSCIHALREPEKRRDWMMQFLSNLLDDKTDTGWRYGPDYGRHPIRICDEAAKSLVEYLPNVEFEYEQNAEFLDQQIAKIKRVLAGEKGISFARPQPASRPADFPSITPLHVLHRSEYLWYFHSIFDGESIWVQDGGSAIKIDAKSGEILARVSIERREGMESYLPGGKSGHTYAYYGRDGGQLLEREVRTGRVTTEVKTPFHDGVKFDDPLQVRNLDDVTMCGEDSQWLMACTADGALHSVEVQSGKHRVEHRFKVAEHGFSNPSLHSSRKNSRILIEGIGGDSPFDSPLHLWDQSNKTLRTIMKAPSSGWTAFWGSLALNSMNGHPTIWNLDEVQEIELPWRQEPIASVTCSHDESRLFVLRQNGSIDVMRVVDGTSVVPLRRLLPAVTRRIKGSLTVSDDNRYLLWHANPEKAGHSGLADSTKTVVALYDVGDDAE